MCVGVGGEPGKNRAHPPTQRGGGLWSCCGSGRFGDTMPWSTRGAARSAGLGRFGDTMPWSTRGARGARGWDASAIPPRAVPGRYKGIHCLSVCFFPL